MEYVGYRWRVGGREYCIGMRWIPVVRYLIYLLYNGKIRTKSDEKRGKGDEKGYN
jgi:hypothetical protein